MIRVDITEDGIVDFIDRHANREYWKVLVAAIQRHAASKGLVFAKTGEPVELTAELKSYLSYALACARRSFLSPNEDQEQHMMLTQLDVEDGFAGTYLESILAALKSQGITPRDNRNELLAGDCVNVTQ